ncbi:hypothetical protein [Agromyces mariniharenae]|uniref:Uncharacterized protein n=1 Tax=Agromyces mariniharenae TaxID=2604423 RepID=A0A5S4UZC1_9MICO|nr:hypothetical protein [Agromyces mariniharenae]TYL52304.1 hypothetical protein FYC51_00565 [Agromyces mariniharenae]
MPPDDARSELEARVYSRAGADEPRVERFDPETGDTLVVSESEWLLLQADRAARSATGDAESASADESAAEAFVAEQGPSDAATGRRWRPATTTVVAAMVGLAAGAALVAGGLWAAGTTQQAPTLELAITPAPTASEMLADETLYSAAALEIFRDPARDPGSLPSWLREVFPEARVARLVAAADGPIPGVSVYAATTDYTTACLIVRLDASGMVWNCRPIRNVLEDGMRLHAPIPANVGTDADLDGDGISGDASRTDLLTVDWHADGSFDVRRTSG